VADRDEIVLAIREAIAPMWRETQDRTSNVRDSLRNDLQGTEARVAERIDAGHATLDARLVAVEARLADVIANIEKLWERQPVVVDFERFRKLEERLARLEEKLGH
jgi:hypothetical protein